MIARNISERWNVFQQKKAESFLFYKGEILIIIYGAYKPPSDRENLGEKERLIKLRDHLKKDGYVNTCIVEEFPYDKISVSQTLIRVIIV